MSKSYHVVYTPDGGTRQDEKITSFDTYEQAKAIAQVLYNRTAPGSEIKVTHAGLVVWGPYVKSRAKSGVQS